MTLNTDAQKEYGIVYRTDDGRGYWQGIASSSRLAEDLARHHALRLFLEEYEEQNYEDPEEEFGDWYFLGIESIHNLTDGRLVYLAD